MTARIRVQVLALGGTISMTGADESGVRPTLSAEQLLRSVDTAPDLDISAETLMTVPGAHLTIDDILRVQARAREELDEGAAGVVVVQGTDTLEEAAFVADLVHDRPEPVVFTGAMRHPESLGADGPANLRDAIVAAVSVRDAGVLVCMGTELHAARFVAKTQAFSPAAFVSMNSGPVGWVIENRASLLTRLPDKPRFALDALPPGHPDPYVPIHRVSLGDDATSLQALASSEPAGLILEGFGVGHVNPETADVAQELATRIPVVLASRTGAGTVLTSTYGFVGSERDLLGRGLISAGPLNGLKARLLLSLCLRAGYDQPATADTFAAWSETRVDTVWPSGRR